MLKKRAIRKIVITSLSLLIVMIIYLLAGNNKVKVYDDFYYINNEDKMSIYTLTDNNYVAKAMVYLDNNKNILERIKDILNIMIIGNSSNALLPEYFNPVIPNDTKILSVKIKDNILYINFSKEFLNIDKDVSRSVIESLVYTLTNFKEIEGIKIEVDGKTLNYIPNTDEKIGSVLTKDFGINKVYDITSNEDIVKTIIYYAYKDGYFIPVTKYSNSKKKSIEIIIDELSEKYSYSDELKSYLNSGLKLLNYKITDNKITLVVNEKIYDDMNLKSVNDKAIKSIIYSIFDSYDVDVISIFYKDNKILEKARKDIEI